MDSSTDKEIFESTPEWESGNFWGHYGKHLKDENCLKMYPPSRSGDPISEDEYRRLSKMAVSESWAVATFYDNDNRERRRFYVDGELVLAITSYEGRHYITCYHKHPHDSIYPNACEMMMERTEDDRKEMFKRWVEDMENDGRWQEVNWEQREG